MTINKACIKKSLIMDYRNIGIAAAIGFVIIGLLWGLITYLGQINVILAIIVQPFTAVNVFIATEIIAIGCWAGAAVIADQTTETVKEDMRRADTTPMMILFSSIVMAGIYGMYYIFSETNRCIDIPFSPLPDVVPIFLILLAINAFIICPLSVAYMRCKEW